MFQWQAMTQSNADLLSIWQIGTHLSEIWIDIKQTKLKNTFENAMCKITAILSSKQEHN